MKTPSVSLLHILVIASAATVVCNQPQSQYQPTSHLARSSYSDMRPLHCIQLHPQILPLEQLHGLYNWMPLREAVVVGSPTLLLLFRLSSPPYQKNLHHGPLQSIFNSLTHAVVVAESSMPVVVFFYQFKSQWPLPSTLFPPPPSISIGDNGK